MSIHLRPDQEAHLQEIAARSGRDASELAQEWVDDLIEYDSWFRQKVAGGRAQLDRGEFITHEEVGARLARLFHS
jgi:predicted transcriptional regulator